MTRQSERRAETRQRLLDAAATLFSEHGIEASPVDAIAARAQRTSGAIYDHFGGKEGLLVALLDEWVGAVATIVSAEVAAATTAEEHLASYWRAVATPHTDGRWIDLEHELWAYATRNPAARDRLLRRYRAAWAGLEDALGASGRGAAIAGVLLGLAMMRRVDPGAVDDATALAVLSATANREPIPET